MSIETQVLATVTKIIQKKVEINQELIVSGLIDSMSAMELIAEIDQEFGVEIPFEQILDILSNTTTLVDFVAKNVK